MAPFAVVMMASGIFAFFLALLHDLGFFKDNSVESLRSSAYAIFIIGFLMWRLYFKSSAVQMLSDQLDTPIKLRVLVCDVGERGYSYFATVFVDRRTGKMYAPDENMERYLERAPEQVPTSFLRSPYWHPVKVRKAEVCEIEMLGKFYYYQPEGGGAEEVLAES